MPLDNTNTSESSNNLNNMKNNFSPLLINESPMQFLPSLADKIGVNESLFLQQIHYWLNHSKHIHDERRWIYNTFKDWHKQFYFLSKCTLERIVKSLRDRKLIIVEKLSFNKAIRTNWYTIDYEQLNSLFIKDISRGTELKPASTAIPSICGDDPIKLQECMRARLIEQKTNIQYIVNVETPNSPKRKYPSLNIGDKLQRSLSEDDLISIFEEDIWNKKLTPFGIKGSKDNGITRWFNATNRLKDREKIRKAWESHVKYQQHLGVQVKRPEYFFSPRSKYWESDWTIETEQTQQSTSIPEPKNWRYKLAIAASNGKCHYSEKEKTSWVYLERKTKEAVAAITEEPKQSPAITQEDWDRNIERNKKRDEIFKEVEKPNEMVENEEDNINMLLKSISKSNKMPSYSNLD